MFSMNSDLAEASSLWTTKADDAVMLRALSTGPGSEKPMTLPAFFQEKVLQAGQKAALGVKRNGRWIKWTYQQYHDDVVRAAKAFIKLGVKSFHGVGIIGFNTPEWLIGFLGAIYAGGLPTGFYTTSSPDAIQYMASHSEANVILVEDGLQLEKILQVWDRLPQLKAVVQYTGTVSKKLPNIYTWSEFINHSVGVPNSKVQERLDLQKPNKCCSIIYTSGTTGRPKGVMISHDSYTWCAMTGMKSLDVVGDEVFLSYLPLSHIAAQLFDMLAPLASQGTCYFAQPDALKILIQGSCVSNPATSLKQTIISALDIKPPRVVLLAGTGSLIETLREVKPTVYFGVPRIWEKIAEALVPLNKPSARPIDARSLFGLDRAHLMMSGAAPIARSTLELLHKFKMQVVEGYGMSETTGLHARCPPNEPASITSVGIEFPGVGVKIDNPDVDGNGEICMYGRQIFMGYLKSEDQTKEALDRDGWLHSGDVGRRDRNGFLYITGRIKEIVITAGGENIAPYPLEANVKDVLPVVSNCMVVGDSKRFLSLLITLKTEADPLTMQPQDDLTVEAKDWCKSVGSDCQTVSEVLARKDPNIYRAMQAGIDKANKLAVSHAAWIQKWAILPRDFSVPGGELGPTLKLRRPQVLRMYENVINNFYDTELNRPTRGKL